MKDATDKTELIEEIEYETGHFLKFTDTRVFVDDSSIPYEDLTGYSFDLTNTTWSVMAIPITNDSWLSLVLHSKNKTLRVNTSAASPFLKISQKQARLSDLLSVMEDYIKKYVTPHIYARLVEQIDHNQTVNIGALQFNSQGLTKPGVLFGRKPLVSYGGTRTEHGSIVITSKDEADFDRISFAVENTHVIPYLLDYIYLNKPLT